jgi:two-component system response regulator AtoC
LKTVKSRLELLYAKGPNSLVNDQTKEENSQHGTILIVDDEQIQRKLLSAYFFKANFLVETAQDGIEALEIAQTKSLDAIIAAKNLPKLDGLSLKNQLNEMAHTANILFILTTYRKTPDTILRANRFNVDHVLEKPLIFEEILGLIGRHQRLRR